MYILHRSTTFGLDLFSPWEVGDKRMDSYDFLGDKSPFPSLSQAYMWNPHFEEMYINWHSDHTTPTQSTCVQYCLKFHFVMKRFKSKVLINDLPLPPLLLEVNTDW